MKLIVLISLVVDFLVFAEGAGYANRIYSVNIENDQQLNVLRDLHNCPDGIEFQVNPTRVGEIVDLIIPPHKFADISELFDTYKFTNRISTRNLQELIHAQQPQILDDFGWKEYYNLSSIYGWLDQMLAKYPTVLTNYNFGKSYEGRPLRAIKVSHKKGNPTIFIESNIHAAEWITSTAATYFLNELVTSNRTEIRYLAENYDWIIVPVFNVDGYEYTHTTNPSWRKSRKPNPNRPNCIGIDLNRNFDSHFGEAGASTDPCSEYYAGPNSFSEIETKSLSEFVKTLDVKIYLSFHSFGQFLVFPTGYNKKHVRNYDDLMRIGLKARSAILKRYGTNYAVGSIAETIYLASGNSIDWAYDQLNIPLAYTFELRGPFPDGENVPTDQIIPNALEIIDGLVAMIKEAKSLDYL